MDVDQNERVVKVGSCWRWGHDAPWMVDAIEGDNERDRNRLVTLARWRDGVREDKVTPCWALLEERHGWRECDPELMEQPVVGRVPVHTSGDTGVRTVPGRIDSEALRPTRDRPVRPDPVPRGPEDGISRDPWTVYEDA